MLTNPLAYSALAVSTRSPGRRPSDQNAWCQANVRVLDEGDLVGSGAEQGRHLGVGPVEVVGAVGRQLVAPGQRLGLQPLGLSIQHGPGGQAAPGVVEVGDQRAPGRVRPGPVDVDRLGG